jgi:hypothetical protein
MGDGELTAKLAGSFGRCPTCPACGGAELYGEFENGGNDGDVDQKVECGGCGARWVEHFAFRSASGFVRGGNP